MWLCNDAKRRAVRRRVGRDMESLAREEEAGHLYEEMSFPPLFIGKVTVAFVIAFPAVSDARNYDYPTLHEVYRMNLVNEQLP